MNQLEKFYTKTIKYHLFNKFNYNNVKNIPLIKKIILNFGCKDANLKQIESSLLAFELITNQKGKTNVTKHSNILFKIRKGNPTGCKITLYKIQKFHFLSRMFIEILPKLKKSIEIIKYKKIKQNAFSFELNELLIFPELGTNYYLFNSLSKLNITIVTNTKTKNETYFLLKFLKFPFLK